jgi:prepilin-type N-terminal cleavage/methylation domain-containing protein
MKSSLNRKGFTLLEILIVIVILGIVAGLAIPAYTGNVFKAQAQEAIATAQVVKDHMLQYHQSAGGAYTNASLNPANAGYIGFDPNTAQGGQTNHFQYALSGVGANAYTLTATCNTAASGTYSPINGCGAGDTIVMNAAGAITRNGRFQ